MLSLTYGGRTITYVSTTDGIAKYYNFNNEWTCKYNPKGRASHATMLAEIQDMLCDGWEVCSNPVHLVKKYEDGEE